MFLFSLVAFVGFFWREFLQIWDGMRTFALSPSAGRIPQQAEMIRSVFVIGSNCAVGIAVFLGALFLLAPYVLPVQTWEDRKVLWKRMQQYLSGSHGPALFVREGKAIAEDGEQKSTRPGVLLVNLCSAVILERQPFSQDAEEGALSERNSERVALALAPEAPTMRPNASVRRSTARVAGPGVTFLEKGERIRTILDLRPQFRKRSEVLAYTRDGVEVKTDVSVVVTLGAPPEELFVAYSGDAKSPSDLRVVELEEQYVPENQIRLDKDGFWYVAGEERAEDNEGDETVPYRRVWVVTQIIDSLDEDDKAFIYYQTQQSVRGRGETRNASRQSVRVDGWRPFILDEERLLRVAYHRARRSDRGHDSWDWAELPLNVAVEIFRDMISRESYDGLYLPNDPERYPLRDFRKRFTQTVCNQGVLSFRILPQQIHRVGQIVDVGTIPPARELLGGRKVLRERGIKVVTASFSGLVPTNPEIQETLLHLWAARWEKETNIVRAKHELDATRIRNRARVQTQREMTYTLARIFHESRYSLEALAVRVFQALEAAAADPLTRHLLPRDAINMLWNLRQWLLPEEKPEQDRSKENGATPPTAQDEETT